MCNCYVTFVIECTFEEIMPLFIDESILYERELLSGHLGTSKDFMRCVEDDLEQDKMTCAYAVIDILVEWRSRNSTTATLGALLEIVGKQAISNSVRGT